jgi:hypothetical protein
MKVNLVYTLFLVIAAVANAAPQIDTEEALQLNCRRMAETDAEPDAASASSAKVFEGGSYLSTPAS